MTPYHDPRGTWPSRLAAAGLLCLMVSLSGCGGLQTEYGRSVGASGEKSLNGFAVLRDVFRRRGWEDRTVARLSERLNNVDAIVWTPSTVVPPDQEVIEWFEEWLQRGDKTLVYVIRDHQTEADYWREAAKHAPPEQRVEYRRRVARAVLEQQRQLLARPSMIAFGWFTAEPADPPESIGQTGGSWAAAVGEFDPRSRIEYHVRPAEDSDLNTAGVSGSVHLPSSPPMPAFWEPGLSDTEVELDTPLATAGGAAVVARVSDETWNDSQILVVAGGSLLNNFGLLEPASQRLAMRLIDASDVAGRTEAAGQTGAAWEPKIVGFLYSDEWGVTLSSLDPSKMGPSGLEMLTVWPLNLVTIHAAVLGLVVCLVLLPIFGRPRRLPPRSNADFAVHIDAVAALMARTSDEHYARAKISEYMTRIRGESEGPWVLPPKTDTSKTDAPKTDAPQAAPPQAADSSHNPPI